MERLAEENAFLKKQLLAQCRVTPTAAQQPGAAAAAAAAAAATATAAAMAAKGKGTVPAAATPSPAQTTSCSAQAKGSAPESPKAKAPRGAVLLAVCLFAGMFFTSVDLFQDRVPQLYTAPDAVDMPREYEAAGAMPGRGAGRVLLAATSADEERQRPGGPRSLGKRDLLVVTLLDHLVSQLGAHASSSLFGRVCRKLVEMKVLKGCDFLSEDGGLDAVRAQYVAEFAELNDVFVQDSEAVQMDAEFTFDKKQPGNAVARRISSAPPRPPTMPLPGRGAGVESWETLNLNEMLRQKFSQVILTSHRRYAIGH